MGERKYIHLVFLVGMIVMSWIMINLTEWIWGYFARPERLWVSLIGVAAGAIFVGRYWMRKSAFEWVSLIVNELKRVTWPTKQETSSATYVVIITVFISAIIMFTFDWFWSFVTDWILTS
ncbi:preprotein translocase subunit SecE [Myxococcota bacterium]|nr:preprotein translocase subunit SecE [Myxococcota bacterium]MBU1382643.1 preprotein translocase subunit SecE [Myxococcota bacterium]MBU1495860.1 preprotein translocase subunit SecE [Myxococcota bacterium]